ncbi:VOC family protein [Aquabacterium sp.]|uniref:VOC family protein n=1 Tax=Aquabacterium sp. TaxID=1872578 RepID=UPI00351CBB6B
MVMAGECPDALPVSAIGDHSYFAYVQVEGIDELHEAFSQRGVTFVKSLRDEAWGMREFGIETIDGHRMMFGQACLPA